MDESLDPRCLRFASDTALPGRAIPTLRDNQVQEFLNHPAVQGGVAPFFVGLIVAAGLQWVRLSGLAILAAFLTAVYLVSGFTFSPLTAARKMVLLAGAASVVGLLVDFAFKPTSVGNALIVVASAAAGVWVFWSILVQKELAQALLSGGTIAVFVAVMIAIGLLFVQLPVRAGSAALTLGLGVGISALLGASAVFALYGIGLAAGAGGFLVVQMVTGKRIFAGATLMLPAALTCSLLAAGTMLLAKLPWYALPVLALVPLTTLFSLPAKIPIWLRAVLRSVCAMMVAGFAFYLTWQFAGDKTA